MRICFVSEESVQQYASARGKRCDGEEVDIVLFSGAGLGEVCYDKELKGETDALSGIGALSAQMDGIVVGGCVTATRGHKRKSAVVAEKGKLIGVADMLHVIDGEVSSGATLRVYETKIGKMGVVVGNDVFFPEVFKSLSLCGSDFIVCVYDDLQGIEQVLIRANAFSYGVPILFCAKGYAMIADSTGEVLFASSHSPSQTSFVAKKEYHLVETRRCGFIHIRKDF